MCISTVDMLCFCTDVVKLATALAAHLYVFSRKSYPFENSIYFISFVKIFISGLMASLIFYWSGWIFGRAGYGHQNKPGPVQTSTVSLHKLILPDSIEWKLEIFKCKLLNSDLIQYELKSLPDNHEIWKQSKKRKIIRFYQ